MKRMHMLGATLLTLALATTAQGQTRVVIPDGTVFTVRTQTILDSSTATVGQTFETAVAETLRVDAFPVIPEGSRVRGVVTYTRAADRRNSGVIGVEFDRLTLPNGTAYAINGKLTSTDATERRQIDEAGGEVVLVGGRGGIGASIAAGSAGGNDPFSGLLGALGALLSEGVNVRVPANTVLAVQLEQGLTVRVSGPAQARASDAYTIYTSPDMVRAAQQALTREGYYRGAASGQLNDATQLALFEYQIDKGILATGNLDGRTVAALGLTAGGATALTAEEATLLRRSADALTARYRTELGVNTTGRLSPRRSYTAAELELWFALTAFAVNAGLYEQIVRTSGHVEGSTLAGEALVAAARRVDAALTAAQASVRVEGAWETIRQTLETVDPEYPSS